VTKDKATVTFNCGPTQAKATSVRLTRAGRTVARGTGASLRLMHARPGRYQLVARMRTKAGRTYTVKRDVRIR
jgi:hypothetical protein